MVSREGQLLRIFIGEGDRYEGVPLYEWLVRMARKHHMAGATVLRGLEGFGAHSRMHTAKILRLSQDLPIIVEIVDTQDKIQSFLDVIDGAIEEGLATLETIRIHFCRSGASPAASEEKP